MSNQNERNFFNEVATSSIDAQPEIARATKSTSVPAKKANPPKPDHIGHRQRLRQRFSTSGGDALSDYELLEMLLFRTIQQADTKSLAKRLLKEFGSLGEVLGASPKRLLDVKGVGTAISQDLQLTATIAQRMLKGKVKGRQVLSSWTEVLEYCHASMAFEDREQLRILFLDKKNCLIRDEKQQVGTVDHTPVYPREVIRRALELSASAIILVHNHPSGDPTPSRADIEMTKLIMAISEPLGISVHDHIIIGKKGHSNMKGLRLI